MFLETLNDKMRVLLVYEHNNTKGIGKIYSLGAILTFILFHFLKNCFKSLRAIFRKHFEN